MTRQILTRPSAEARLTSQMGWYLRHAAPELAERFLKAVQGTAEALLDFPGMGFRPEFRHPSLQGLHMHPVKGFEKHLLLYAPTPDGIELVRVYHAARDVDKIIRARLEQVEQGAPLILHEEATRHIEERLRSEKPDQPEAT
jgi:toxin ParE1/3/4